MRFSILILFMMTVGCTHTAKKSEPIVRVMSFKPGITAIEKNDDIEKMVKWIETETARRERFQKSTVLVEGYACQKDLVTVDDQRELLKIASERAEAVKAKLQYLGVKAHSLSTIALTSQDNCAVRVVVLQDQPNNIRL